MSRRRRVLMQATINLPGLPAGRRAFVDPTRPYERACIEADYLIPVTEEDDDGEADRAVQASAVPAGRGAGQDTVAAG